MISPSPPKTESFSVKSRNRKEFCTSCAAYQTKECLEMNCPYFIDFARDHSGDYGFLLQNCFKSEKPELLKKIMATEDFFKGNWFVSKKHKERFDFALYSSQLNLIQGKYSQIATIYLLTVENPLWQMARKSAKYPSFLSQARDIEGVSTDQYALYHVANSISKEEKYEDLKDLCQNQLVSAQTFNVILRSLMLSTYGGELLLLNWDSK